MILALILVIAYVIGCGAAFLTGISELHDANNKLRRNSDQQYGWEIERHDEALASIQFWLPVVRGGFLVWPLIVANRCTKVIADSERGLK